MINEFLRHNLSPGHTYTATYWWQLQPLQPPCNQNRHFFSCRSIGNQSVTNHWPAGDWLAIGGWELSKKISDQTVLELSATTATDLQPVTNQLPTSPWPQCDLSTINLVTEGFHVQQAKPPRDHLSLRLFCDLCNLSVTSQWLPCNSICDLPATAQNDHRKEVADKLQAVWLGL